MLKAKYFSFSKKLLILFCVPFILVSIITSMLCSSTLKRNINAEIKDSLRSVALSLDSTYSNLYEGDYRRDMTYALYKGDTKISGKTELLDDIKERAGIETSFYYEDKIVITTLKREAGGRATGLQMEKDIYSRICNGEELFFSEYELQGTSYFGYFIPLKNGENVVGAIFAGRIAEEVDQKISSQIQIIIILLGSIMLIFLALLFGFSKYLSGCMKRTKVFLKQVADGDLISTDKSKEVRNRDEIGDIYRSAVYLRQELKDIVTNMKNTAGMLLDTSGDLKSMSSNIYQSVNKMYNEAREIVSDAQIQAQETEQAVEQIRSIDKQIEHMTYEMEALQSSIRSMSEAEESAYHAVSDFSTSNVELMNVVEEISNQIIRTNNSVQMIQKTIDIIRDIADETNLLSVNASIEAARSGNAGRGFTVIAEQISRMAGQSAQNAVSVEKTIISLKEESEKMVAIMDKMKEMMNMQSMRLGETISNFEIVEDGVDNSIKSVDSVRNRMFELTNSKDVIHQNIKNQALIADRFVLTTESVTSMVKTMQERMKDLEQTAVELESISNGLCSGLDIFKC